MRPCRTREPIAMTKTPDSSAGIRLVPQSQAVVQTFPWGELHWFASAEIGGSTELTLGRCEIAPGQANPRHYHPNCHEVLTVLAGTIAHTLDEGRDVPMQPGDTVVIPPHTWHRARNMGSTRAVLLIAFSTGQRATVGET